LGILSALSDKLDVPMVSSGFIIHKV